MPAKNNTSESFAVSEEKVQRKSFSFGPRNMALLREVANQNRGKPTGGVGHQSALDQRTIQGPQNRHRSRNDGMARSIDFVYHVELKGPRLASDGGSFPVN